MLDRSGASSIAQFKELAHQRLTEDNRSIFIFPQGTRNRKEIVSFKNGAFTIALNSGCPIVPCTIEYEPDLWSSDKFMRKEVVCKITVHPRVEVDKESDTVEGLREKCYKIVEEPFFGKIPEKPYVKEPKPAAAAAPAPKTDVEKKVE
jgi:1-acyl-sn-glycerol-3-phosphate acyltransferase